MRDIKKKFPADGDMQLFRLVNLEAFTCLKCHKDKKSKMVAVKDGDWDNLICNGCYGQILAELTEKSKEKVEW